MVDAFKTLAVAVAHDSLGRAFNVRNSDAAETFRVRISRAGSEFPCVTWYLSRAYELMREKMLEQSDGAMHEFVLQYAEPFLATARDYLHTGYTNEGNMLLPMICKRLTVGKDGDGPAASGIAASSDEDISAVSIVPRDNIFAAGVCNAPWLEWVFFTFEGNQPNFVSIHEGVLYEQRLQADNGGQSVLGEAANNAYSALSRWGAYLWQKPYNEYQLYQIRVPCRPLLASAVLSCPELIEDLNLPGRPVVFPVNPETIYVTSSLDAQALECAFDQAVSMFDDPDYLMSKCALILDRDAEGFYVWNPFNVSDAMANLPRTACGRSVIASDAGRLNDLPSRFEVEILKDHAENDVRTSCCWGCGVAWSTEIMPKRCKNCHSAEYCSKECQKKDWCKHKGYCQKLSHRKTKLKSE